MKTNNSEPDADELENSLTKLVTKGLEKFMKKPDIIAFVGDLVIELERIDRTRALAILEEVEEAAPKDLKLTASEPDVDWFYGRGNNLANREWRTIIARLKDKYGGIDA